MKLTQQDIDLKIWDKFYRDSIDDVRGAFAQAAAEIRRQALEEAARTVETWDAVDGWVCANRIRALAQPNGEGNK